ncbi:MAG: DNA mismatch repair endonuclease MutL [Candidatus Cloacimonetes bacterium]|nr:DNA mismatch repair endonuclease MutL [Candidatus Cloacimonadota bacterium]
MAKIKILAEEVANRIAAGEVIERPASVVKELVENSLDAAADQITVIIEDGGKKLIQVIDNGCGMNQEDAVLSFERHATSKIRTVSDIFTISSLGFRGEALPSIASVSDLKLITRDRDSEIATQIEYSGGRLIKISPASANPGTTITVAKLFHNVPARKKFLKSTPVEYKHILNFLHYQSLLHPEVHFKFISNSQEKLNYPTVTDRQKRLLDIFGSDFLNLDLIVLKQSIGDIALSGYIGGLEQEMESVSDLHYLFINGRYIRDKIIYHSIKSAYEPFIRKLRIYQQGQTPPYILFLELTPGQVDYNVHPAKLEVRFHDPGQVHNFVKNTISNALLDYEDRKFVTLKQKISGNLEMTKPTELEKKIFTSKTDKRRFSDIRNELKNLYQPDIFRESSEENQKLAEHLQPQSREWYLKPEEEIINPWQLHQSYIFVQVADGLMIIDQHAAHERILYEKILHRIHGAPAPSQKLLFPIVLDLPPYISSLIQDQVAENLEIFHKIGFNIKTFSGNSLVIDEIPSELEDWNGGEVFIEILKNLQEEFEETEDFRDSLAKSVSCKAAIKAGKKMGRKEMLALINDLFACEVPYFCPHGRPLIIKMTMTEFEKRFKRI